MEERIKTELCRRKMLYDNLIKKQQVDNKEVAFLRGKIAAIADVYYMIDRIERGDVNV